MRVDVRWLLGIGASVLALGACATSSGDGGAGYGLTSCPSIPLPAGELAPMAFAATGLSEFDGSIKATATYATPPTDMPKGKYVNVWVTDGPWFLAVGGGARYQIPTPGPPVALTAALRMNLVVGGNGVLPTFGPELGAAAGF
jgi:hypothetical protein